MRNVMAVIKASVVIGSCLLSNLVNAETACATKLLQAVGKIVPEGLGYTGYSVEKSKEFLDYLSAIIHVESAWNEWAVSHKDARGLMQMTPVAIEEAWRTCPTLSPAPNMYLAADNIAYGSCFLKHLYYGIGKRNWVATLIAYNGGYKQLTMYERGDRVIDETAQYVLRVHRALQLCRAK